MILNPMIEHADLYRELAVQRRNRGLHTGKSAVGWDTVRRELDAGTWDHHFASARAAVAAAISIIQEDYLRDVFPERYESFEL